MIDRKKEPYKNCKAFPGGHVDPGPDNFGERVVEAAIREFREEVGIPVVEEQLFYVGFYDKPHRDPRGWYIGHVYYTCFFDMEPQVKAGDDASCANWTLLQDVCNLAFDHRKILIDTLHTAKTALKFVNVDANYLSLLRLK